MKLRKGLLVLVLALALLSLTACSGTAGTAPQEEEAAVETGGEEAAAETAGEEAAAETGGEETAAETAGEEAAAETAGEEAAAENGEAEPSGAADVLTNDGLELPVPAEYAGLLITKTPQDSDQGVLFSVFEKASVDAAKANGIEQEGPGWLFSIARIDQTALNEKLCYDMSGERVFARDGDNRFYIFQTPTDVRFERESYENVEEDMKQWSALTEWGGTVPETFLSANPGLTAEQRGNTEVDMFLARVAYMEGVNYTISTTEFGPMEPKDVDPAPYLDRLTNGVVYERVDGEEAPDGEYVVLNFPDDEIRFDFFFMTGKENYVRQVWGENDENALLYRAVPAAGDGSVNASEIMNDWYHALVEAN